MSDHLAEGSRPEIQPEPVSPEILIQRIKEEGLDPSKISTRDIASFYLASDAYQALQEATKNPINPRPTREQMDSMWAKTKLTPILEGRLKKIMGQIAYASALSIIKEILEQQTQE